MFELLVLALVPLAQLLVLMLALVLMLVQGLNLSPCLKVGRSQWLWQQQH